MPTSLDRNQRAFAERLQRLDRLHRQGRSFHTANTYVRPPAPTLFLRLRYRLGRVLRLALILAVLGWVMKGVIFYAVGADVYVTRVEALTSTDTEFDRAAAWLMQPDGATVAVAEVLAKMFPTHIAP